MAPLDLQSRLDGAPADADDTSTALLERLVSFPTVSSDSNLALIDWVREYLDAGGVSDIEIWPNEDGRKAALFARVGPNVPGGIILSGHSDVVPVTDQTWTRPAFAMTAEGDRLFGRGTCDMKGFVASALRTMRLAARSALTRPLMLALSYDEEIGCLGVRPMLADLVKRLPPPQGALIGEPTAMAVASGHKGKAVIEVVFAGMPCHSSIPDNGRSALLPAARLALWLDEQQAERRRGPLNSAFEPAHSTISTGQLLSGTAVNIVPGRASVLFEIRVVPEDDIDGFLGGLHLFVDHLKRASGVAAEITIRSRFPGLATPADHAFLQSIARAAGTAEVTTVPYGCEAGLFQQAGIPAVICGPGRIELAHQPDEWIGRGQLAQCDLMLERIVTELR